MSPRGASRERRDSLRYALYERCVQDPVLAARFLHAVHGGEPTVLREDFCGGAAICREWVEWIRNRGQGDSKPGARRARPLAIAVDKSAEAMRLVPRRREIARVRADVRACDERGDVIAALNFPIGYWHTRADLLDYLRLTRRRLNRGGVFVCDLYGGRDAFTTGITTKRLRGPCGERIVYRWEQREADAVTARVLNALHFSVAAPATGRRRGTPAPDALPVCEILDAFVYDWRLWSIAELGDAMREAGFSSVEVHDRLGDAVDSEGNLYPRAMEPGDALDENHVVYVVARR